MHGVISAAMWPTGSSAATANKKLAYHAVGAKLGGGGVEWLPKRDQPVLVGALGQSQGVGAAERVEEGGVLSHVVGERGSGQLSRRDALEELVVPGGLSVGSG